ncbi:structural maintenance of chromosomes 6 [Cotesia typhae]|uniref:structural maintenance of chromosomes 6 n=1 Tax=Cotesia typhae TaxID=2053667 RepID=UPI003D68A5B4
MSNSAHARAKRKICNSDEAQGPKRAREDSEGDFEPVQETRTAGKILSMHLRNIMCHESLRVDFNPNVNFIIGKNGSGKSAIISAIAVVFGARANVTQRANSLNKLIRDHCGRASIEIVLSNVGSLAFKPELYGDSIKITRVLGQGAKYTMANSRGKVISKSKVELEKMKTCMNIQVENPISVLNQSKSSNFLMNATESDLYELFMQSTQLSIINDNYKSAVLECQETSRILGDTSKQLNVERKEIEALENNLRRLALLENTRAEYDSIQVELKWALAIMEEDNLEMHENRVKTYQEKVRQFEDVHQDSGNKIQNINTELENLNAKLDEIELESQTSREAYVKAKAGYQSKKEEVGNKDREIKQCWRQIQKYKEEIVTYTNEIERLEGGSSQAEMKRNEQRQKAAQLREKFAEIEALLNTTKTDLSHLETTKVQYEKEDHLAKMDADKKASECSRIASQLQNFQKSGGTNNVFGRNMERLKRRVDEEHNRGRFLQKPIGPIGEFIKVKDPSWIPAVENVLAPLNAFCTDNGQDAKLLGNIIQEIYGKETWPTIFCSKFHNRVHDVSRKCVRDQNYSNLFDMMEISNTVVANCIIDQKEPECLLLIPTSEAAKELLSHARNVPRNCKRATTKKGDMFFPDPMYRTYGGKVGKANFLQVSTTEVIQRLKEEYVAAEEERKIAYNDYKVKHDQLMVNIKSCSELQVKIKDLIILKERVRRQIADLEEALQEDLNDNCAVFKADKLKSETLLKGKENEYAKLLEEKAQIENQLKELAVELKACQKNTYTRGDKVAEVNEKIQKLQAERAQINSSFNGVKKRIESTRQELDTALEECNKQRQRTSNAVNAAQRMGERVQTDRSPTQLQRLIQVLGIEIETVEHDVGSKEELESLLVLKRKKSADIIELHNGLQKVNKQHQRRVEQRREEFQKMKKFMARKVKEDFLNIIGLRNFDGSLIVDYKNKKVKLEVIPSTTDKQASNAVHTLSGGERSYSTAAFILALWECTTLPFYFLDEIDVFMDKVNRKTVYDLLLHHASIHPERQFGFLTPLDASIFKGSATVKILRLAPPNRGTQSQPQTQPPTQQNQEDED